MIILIIKVMIMKLMMIKMTGETPEVRSDKRRTAATAEATEAATATATATATWSSGSSES